MRSVPLWRGKTDDTPAPPRVRLRIFERYEGKCYLSGRRIMPGDKWELEHCLALSLGGENAEENLAPVLVAPHKIKTKEDRKAKAKTDSLKKKHFGIGKKKSRFPGSKDSQWKAKVGGGWERR